MPIAQPPEETPAPLPPPGQIEAAITEPKFKTALVDIKVQNLASLITHIGGSSWTVNYYSQVLGADDEPSPYQPGQLAPYQQYLLINKMEMKLQGPLAVSQDSETSEMIATGTAIIYPFLKPNTGDAFLADIGDGKTGQFTITSNPVKKTLMKQTCYEVSFALTREADQVLIDHINSCVVQTTEFRSEFMTYGQNPVLVSEDIINADRLVKYEHILFNRWINDFFSREFSTFLVPGQPFSTYDPFVTRTILRLFDGGAHPLLKRVREMNVGGIRKLQDLNFWDVIMNLDNSIGGVMAQKMWLIPSGSFSREARFETIAYSGIQQVVIPNQVTKSVDNDYVVAPLVTGVDFTDPGDMDWDLASLFINNVPGGFASPDDEPLTPTYGVGEVPYIHPVTLDDFYVFSEFFYTQSALNQSRLELLTNAMLKDEAIDLTALFAICDDTVRWGRLEKFYYTPVLIVLLRVALRKI